MRLCRLTSRRVQASGNSYSEFHMVSLPQANLGVIYFRLINTGCQPVKVVKWDGNRLTVCERGLAPATKPGGA